MSFSANLVPIAVPTLAGSTAANLATYSTQFTANIVNTGNSLLSDFIALKDTDFYMVGDIPTYSPPTIAAPSIYVGPQPTPPDVTYEDLEAKITALAALVAPSAPTLAVPVVSVPELNATAPTITLPLPPSTDVGAAPGGAPSIEDPVLPDAPVITLPNTPSFEDLQLPSPPLLAIPTWTEVAPVNLLTPPTTQFSYVDTGYVSTLHDPYVAKLLLDLNNGTYGIEPADEAGLWFRARDRAARTAAAGVDEAMRRASASSFPMPQGSAYELAMAAEREGQKIVSEAERDIRLRRSELYVAGRKFTMEQVQSYEKIRIDLYSDVQERALNYAKAVVETSIALYDASVKDYTTKLEGYKVAAQVFEARIRAELAKAEIFRTQVEAEKLRVDFNRAKIDQYLAQLKGIETIVELYKSRLTAANVFMQLQGQKLDVFKTQVQAYAERVRAKEAEFGMYTSQIKGQLAAVDVYKAQIDAYNATLIGVDTKARITLQGNEALLQSYKASVQNYSSQLESFSKQLTIMLDEAKVKGVIYGAEVDAYRALVGAVVGGGELTLGYDRILQENSRASLASRVEQVRFRLAQLEKSVELQKSVDSHGMDFLRSALGASAGAINSLGVSTT